MRGAAHNPAFAQKMGIPMGVAMDFVNADRGRDISKLPLRKKPKHAR
jgi:hypothetical protein